MFYSVFFVEQDEFALFYNVFGETSPIVLPVYTGSDEQKILFSFSKVKQIHMLLPGGHSGAIWPLYVSGAKL